MFRVIQQADHQPLEYGPGQAEPEGDDEDENDVEVVSSATSRRKRGKTDVSPAVVQSEEAVGGEHSEIACANNAEVKDKVRFSRGLT